MERQPVFGDKIVPDQESYFVRNVEAFVEVLSLLLSLT